MPNARMRLEPLPYRAAGMAGQVVGDQIEIPRWEGTVQRLEQVEIATGIAGPGGLGQGLPIANAQGSVDPDLRWPRS
jgi:hypothetical protein